VWDRLGNDERMSEDGKTRPVRCQGLKRLRKERRIVNVRYSWVYGSADDVLVRKVVPFAVTAHDCDIDNLNL
jgi:hypothetical protein